jgi:hypothetical protein
MVSADGAQCCSFVAWDVSQDGDEWVLSVTADPGALDDVASIEALFNLE